MEDIELDRALFEEDKWNFIMLCIHAGIASVYAGIVSHVALGMLKRQGVTANINNVVPYISKYDGTDLCPFEKLAESCQRPSQLFASLHSLFAEGEQ